MPPETIEPVPAVDAFSQYNIVVIPNPLKTSLLEQSQALQSVHGDSNITF